MDKTETHKLHGNCVRVGFVIGLIPFPSYEMSMKFLDYIIENEFSLFWTSI